VVADGSCIRLRAERPNHVWAYDFVLVRTRDGRAVRLLTVIDEYTRECLAIRADRHIRATDALRATDAQLQIWPRQGESVFNESNTKFGSIAISSVNGGTTRVPAGPSTSNSASTTVSAPSFTCPMLLRELCTHQQSATRDTQQPVKVLNEVRRCEQLLGHPAI